MSTANETLLQKILRDQKRIENLTGQPADNTSIPSGSGTSFVPKKNSSIPKPSQKRQTISPNKTGVNKWPKGTQVADDPFVQRVIDNEHIFAQHELDYLDNNCEHTFDDDVYDEIAEEISREIDKEILEKIIEDNEDRVRKIIDEVDDAKKPYPKKDRNPFRDPFGDESENPFRDDRDDWRRIISDGEQSRPMFTDSNDTVPMTDEDRTDGTFPYERESTQYAMEKLLNDDE